MGTVQMLDILNKHLVSERKGCSVNTWLLLLPQEEQEAFALVKENNLNISIASLFADLNKEDILPFKLTAFRSHLRGYCTCQS
jgi:hypothetical protein